MNQTPLPDERAPPLVAVVDDDALIVESLQDLLDCAGYAVRTFSSAEALLRSDVVAIVACVISDIAMPVVDGIELQRRLHAVRPGLRVLLMTGVPELAGKFGVTSANRPLVIVKPFDSKELLAAVAAAVAE